MKTRRALATFFASSILFWLFVTFCAAAILIPFGLSPTVTEASFKEQLARGKTKGILLTGQRCEITIVDSNILKEFDRIWLFSTNKTWSDYKDRFGDRLQGHPELNHGPSFTFRITRDTGTMRPTFGNIGKSFFFLYAPTSNPFLEATECYFEFPSSSVFWPKMAELIESKVDLHSKFQIESDGGTNLVVKQ